MSDQGSAKSGEGKGGQQGGAGGGRKRRGRGRNKGPGSHGQQAEAASMSQGQQPTVPQGASNDLGPMKDSQCQQPQGLKQPGQQSQGQGQKQLGQQPQAQGQKQLGQQPQGSGQQPQGQSQKPESQQTQGQAQKQQGQQAQGQGQKKQGQQPQSQSQKQQGPQPQGQGQKQQGQGQKPQCQQPVGAADGVQQKSKAQLKAERRAVQEAQRAAKTAAKGGAAPAAGSAGAKKGGDQAAQQQQQHQVKRQDTVGSKRVPDHLKVDDDKTARRIAKKLEKQQVPQRTVVQKKVGLFNHLHQYEREVSLTKDIKFGSSGIHPAILRLGLQYAEGVICGSNARCIGLLGAMRKVIADYNTPPQKELCRDLEARIKPYISFLTQCRPLSVSMGNAIKYLKWHITQIPTDMPDAQAREQLCECIDEFIEEKIQLADKAISQTYASTKIQDNDVILIYGCSSLIRKVLCDAYDLKKKFRVIIVDGRPKLEGREMLRRLVKHGIQCSYVLINAVSYMMREVTKVFLGAHALLANGYVMSRVGSSQVALLAKSCNVPVLVCCETYKFCERVQTDSFVFNELGDPDDLVYTEQKVAHLNDWRDIAKLSLLNLTYDVTPAELITVVITELGMVPCTSVPVVLRVKQVETEAT